MKKTLAVVAWLALVVSIVGAFTTLLSSLGVWLNLWSFRTGLVLLRYGAYAGVSGAGAGFIVGVPLLLGLGRKSGMGAAAAIVIGVVTAVVPWSWMREASAVPPIHDISTDTETPPSFLDILPLREGANSADYAGEEIASQQRRAYPHIQPLMLKVPREEAFSQALSVARERGWEIVAFDEESGRIEATDTTFWFRFKDDVVIRVASWGKGSRVDVRSLSRVGRSDLGTNARRISRFLEGLAQRSLGP